MTVVKVTNSLVFFCVLASLCCGAHAEEDPFAPGDPFSVIDGAPDVAKQQARHKPEVKAEVFFKAYGADINNSSRINPDNQILKLKELSGLVETRMTLADYLNQQETLRWLFKGYASVSSYREADDALRSTVRIDEIFADWKGDGLFASLGKRRINWGHAQGFNPVNVVAPPRDPLNPTYQTEGRPMIWFSRSGTIGAVDAILTRNYDANWNSNQNRWGLKWSGAGTAIDYAFYYFDGAPNQDGRAYERLVGTSFATDVMPGMTLYMETAWFRRNYRNYYGPGNAVQNKSGSYFQQVIGTLIDLGGKSNLFIEYLYNGQGYSEKEREYYLQTADARLPGGRDQALLDEFATGGLNRSYLLANYKKEIREKYNFNLSVLVARDGSSSSRTEVTYALSDYYEIRSSYLYNAGNRDSEFANNPYRGLFEVGIKASF